MAVPLPAAHQTFIERDNPRLKGVLPKEYARPGLDKHRLGELIDLIGTIGLGDRENRAKDILGRVYEYFLTQFASAEGKNGGQFYTPSCVVRCLVAMLAPYKGRIYDPCCGSDGMFVQSEKFVLAHGGKLGDISIYGQESNATTRRLAVMNLALRGIEADFGPEQADTFRRDLHPDLRACSNPKNHREDHLERGGSQSSSRTGMCSSCMSAPRSRWFKASSRITVNPAPSPPCAIPCCRSC
jgi:type I restriction-modification system DNA methylase subunit